MFSDLSFTVPLEIPRSRPTPVMETAREEPP
jgi:hypothetical protein